MFIWSVCAWRHLFRLKLKICNQIETSLSSAETILIIDMNAKKEYAMPWTEFWKGKTKQKQQEGRRNKNMMHFEQQSVLFADKSRTAHSQSARFSVHIFVLTRHRLRFWRFSNYCFALFVTMLTLARGHIPSHSWLCDGNAQSART